MNSALPVAIDYEVRMELLPDMDSLRILWLELESRSRCSFFVSWMWIGTWLKFCARRYARLVLVYWDSRLVGLGVFTMRRSWFGFGPLHVRLHEAGDRVLDNLTIEYNGLLSDAGHERTALAAVVRHLSRNDTRWSTLYLPGIDFTDADIDSIRSRAIAFRIYKRPTHYVDLAALRDGRKEYVPAALSSNTRSAVRRTSRKLARGFGSISLVAAATTEQKLAFFRSMAKLHEAHWTHKQGHAGAFCDQRITRFHEYLVSESTGGEVAQLLQLRAGPHAIGYVYNFVWRNIVYFYQAGIDYARYGSYGSPGLLLLSQAVEHSLAAGHSRFEFMAGDSSFKRKLCTGEGELVWLSIDRAGWSSQLRSAWRSLKSGKEEIEA